MNAVLRVATTRDAAAIVAVAEEVWPDEALDAETIGRLIDGTQRATSVAELDGTVVGFVDGFLTQTPDVWLRWEVDLLAVSAKAQGRGIGRALVRASVEDGIRAGVTIIRGLIRVGNVASERVFGACGFSPAAEVSQLWVARSLKPPESRSRLHVVPVRTFRYEGIWLENVNVAGLRALRPGDSAGVIGALIPIDDHATTAAAENVGMQPDGEFRFWQRETR